MAKVLIIEDDPLMSRMYQKIFTFEKYEVEMAGDGEEGLAKASSVNPTIILCDVMMPKMNGLQVLEKLKADPATKSIPVVMLTNLSGQQDAETALSHGAVKYIVKSEHEPKEVADMVKEIIAGYTRNEIPGAAPSGPAPAAQPPASPAPPSEPAADPVTPDPTAPEPPAPVEPSEPADSPPPAV